MSQIIRFVGSKWYAAQDLINAFPSHRVYCEPFGGSAAVLLRKPRSTIEILNDY